MESNRRPASIQEQLAILQKEYNDVSAQMIDYAITDPNQHNFAELFYRQQFLKEQIYELKASIPSAGPSPITQNCPKDLRGKKPWRGRR